MNRVPYCAECERCQCTDFIYKDYYCCEENDMMQIFGRLGVDHPPKTSPKWCPLRENNRQYQNEKDSDLPEAPRLEIYQETFGDLKNITNEWYRNNE